MDKKETFTLVYDSLVDLYKEYIDNFMKTLGFIIIALGWIVTSDSSRAFLASSTGALYLSLMAVAIIAIVHTIASIGFYYRSRKKTHLLADLNIVKSDNYESYQIIPLQVAINLTLNLSLLATLFVMILSLSVGSGANGHT